MRRTFLQGVVVAAVMAGLVPGAAQASKVSVTPVLGTLSESRRIESLELKNDSERAVTIQVKLFAWTQDEEGKDRLTPSEALTYMPRIFQLKPGEGRSVRLGYAAKQGPAVEQAYRIYMTEQPQASTDPAEQGQLKVAVRMGVPVFVEPVKPQRDQGVMTELAMAAGMPGFAVQNTGASRLVMSSLVVTGKDAAGATVFTEELGRQFVLAGLKKRFKARLPAKDCARVASLSVLGKLQTTGSLTLAAPVPAGACKP